MPWAEAHEAHLLGERMLELQVALLLGERDDLLEALGIGERRLRRGGRVFRLVNRRWFRRRRRRVLPHGRSRLARSLLIGHRARRALRFPAAVAEAAHQIAGRRQIGGIGEPHQNHVGGGMWPS